MAAFIQYWFETGVVMFTSVCIDGENFRFVIRSDPSDTDNNVNGPVLPPSRQLKIDSSKQLSFVKN